MLKKVLLCSVAGVVSSGVLAADLPARATAPAPASTALAFDAFGSVAAGYNAWDIIGTKLDGLALDARGTFAVPLSGKFGFQADGAYGRSVYAHGGSEIRKNSSALTGHVYMRDQSVGLVGLIAQGISNQSSLVSSHEYYVGAEAQYFLGNVTLYGQAAYQSHTFSVFQSVGVEGWLLAGQARLFATPNWMVALKTSYSDVTSDKLAGVAVKHQAWLAGLKSEYKFDTSPISAFAELDYRRGEYSATGLSQAEKETRGMVGVKWNFGSQNLLQRDRSGSSLDPIRSMMAPAFVVGSDT